MVRGKLKEVVDQYSPDIMWFDYVLDAIPDTVRRTYCAYYLNEAEKWGKDVVIVRKQDDLPLSLSVDDLEKSRKNRIGEEAWMTDETVSKGSWCYTENLEIDIVSKNGVLLLNISPMANGTIPDIQKQVLLDMGAWLEKYGEAIYGTRPWYTFGEGPTKEPEGNFQFHREFLKIVYSEKDVRYTTSDNTIYATLLGLPGAGSQLTFTAFAADSLPEGSDEALDWNLGENGLSLTTPDSAPDEMAIVFKIETK